MSASKHDLAQLNKRISLNLLIQGAASHTYLTAHHLVKEQLDAIDPELTPLYDKVAVNVQLTQWRGFPFGRGYRTGWKRIERSSHPFSGHPFLVKHGRSMSEASEAFTVARAQHVAAWVKPLAIDLQSVSVIIRTASKERGVKPELEALAVQATNMIWGIDRNLLQGCLTDKVAFGNLQSPTTFKGRVLRKCAAGYSGVQRVNSKLRVIARAFNWPLLAHELTKGTAELVCLHGLNKLTEQTYQFVTDQADKLEYEIWMMQAGGEVWRRLLAAIPSAERLAETLMHIALLDPQPLEQLLMDLVEHPLTAKMTIADFFDADLA